MKQTLTYSASDYRSFFLWNHYSLPRMSTRVIRIIGGPWLVLMGILLLKQDDKFEIALAGFSIGYGIYHFTRPFLETFMRPFTSKTFTLEIKETSLRFDSEESNTELFFSHLKTKQTAHYLIIFLSNGMITFFPKEKLDAGMRIELEQFLNR